VHEARKEALRSRHRSLINYVFAGVSVDFIFFFLGKVFLKRQGNNDVRRIVIISIRRVIVAVRTTIATVVGILLLHSPIRHLLVVVLLNRVCFIFHSFAISRQLSDDFVLLELSLAFITGVSSRTVHFGAL